MAIDTTALNKLITDFRALSQKDSVSPESLGSLLQKLADLLASCPADSEVSNALNSVNRTITSLQSDLQNIARSAVTADQLNKALKGKADDFAYYVDTDTIESRSGTLKVASQQIAMAIADIVNSDKLRDKNIEAKADKAELHVVLASMGVTLDNLDSTGDSAIMYVPYVGDIYYSEGKEHLFFKKSETETLDLGEPNDKKIYANAMTKRLYIWRGGTWRQCGGTQIDAYTKAESDARYLRGEVLYEDYYYPNMGETTDKVKFTDSTEILQPTKFIGEYTDENGQTYNCVFECESFPDWFDFAEEKCYPYDNGISTAMPFFKNYTIDNGELIYDFDSMQNIDISKKLPHFTGYVGLKKIDDNHFNLYKAKNGVYEFTSIDKDNVDCSLFAFGPIVDLHTYDIDDCNRVRISLIGNFKQPSRYSTIISSGSDIGIKGYIQSQQLYGNEYVDLEIDKLNKRYRQIGAGYSTWHRTSHTQNWNKATQESFYSQCTLGWSNIINGSATGVSKLGEKLIYSFNGYINPTNKLTMGCKIKIEKLA